MSALSLHTDSKASADEERQPQVRPARTAHLADASLVRITEALIRFAMPTRASTGKLL